MKGRRSNARLAEFGETVHSLIPRTKDMPGKFEERWEDGIWLGCDVRSGEHYIGTENGVFRPATTRRKPLHSRWSPDRIAAMQGSPKEPIPGSAAHRAPAYSRRYRLDANQDEQFVRQQKPDEVPVRDFKIYKEDALKHGATEGCPGCRQSSQEEFTSGITRTNAASAYKTSYCRREKVATE